MAHKDKGHALLPQFVQQLHDLGLYRHIQGRCGLVAQQQPGLWGQRPGNGSPLALAAADLMGITARQLRRQAAALQQRCRLLCCPVPGDAVVDQSLPDGPAQCLAGVERILGHLKDHLHGLPDGTAGHGLQGLALQ